MIGSGKTRAAADLACWLEERGEAARAYAEFAEDHPIRSDVVEQLRRSQAGASNTGSAMPPAHPLGQWDLLAAQCRQGSQTVILESSFLQNAVLPRFADAAPAAEIRRVFDDIVARLAPAAPLLVYLRPHDIEAAIERIHRIRGAEWAAWNMAGVAAFPWAQRLDVTGRQAVVDFYRAWEPVVDRLWQAYPYPKRLVLDPQRDRALALRQITSALRA